MFAFSVFLENDGFPGIPIDGNVPILVAATSLLSTRTFYARRSV
jgi:hypothetical protein